MTKQGRFEEGKSVDVAKWLREKGHDAAADEWEQYEGKVDKLAALPLLRKAFTIPLLNEEKLLRQGKKWETMPKGWTDKSRKEFWESLTSRAPKHKVTECIKRMEGKVDDTGAFCAALADRVLGKKWRTEAAKDRAKKKASDWISLEEMRALCPSCAERMAAHNIRRVHASVFEALKRSSSF